MKVIIAGSRGINLFSQVARAMSLSNFPVTEVVSGGARGVDTLGEYWAQACDKGIKRFPADWNTYGKAAGHLRNTQMAEYADALVAIWDGKSRGTANMISQMSGLGKPLYIHVVEL